MNYESEFTYSRGVAKQAAHELLKRILPRQAAFLLVLVLLAVLGFTGLGQPTAWFALGCIASYFIALITSLRSAVRYASDSLILRLSLSQEGVSLSSPVHSTTLSWRAVSGYFRTASFLFLISPYRPPTPLPLAALSDEALSVIQQKIPSPSHVPGA